MIEAIKTLISTNPLMTAGILATCSGMFWNYLKALPRMFQDKMWKWFSSTVEFRDGHYDFYDIRLWSSTLTPIFTPKSYHVPRGYHLVPGTGTYWYRGYGSIFAITVVEEKDDKGIVKGHKLIFRVVGKNVDAAKNLVKEVGKWIRTKQSNENLLKVCLQSGTRFDTHLEEKRKPSTLFHDVYAQLKEDIQRFSSQKAWYDERGIPYHRGYLLHGPPGTGKTSIIKTVAGELNLPLYSITSIGALSAALNGVVSGVKIVVIEDIDRDFKEQPKLEKMTATKAEEAGFSGFKLSEFLNTVDGIISNQGVIFIFTANNPQYLPEAMLRPGRVDKKFEVGFLTATNIRDYIRLFVAPEQVEALERELLPHAGRATGAFVQMHIMKFLETLTNEVIHPGDRNRPDPCGELDLQGHQRAQEPRPSEAPPEP